MKNYENFNLYDVILKEKKVYIENNLILIKRLIKYFTYFILSIIIVLFRILFKGNFNSEFKPKCSYLYG